MADTANRLLDSPDEYRHLGAAGTQLVRNQYSMEVCLPQMLDLYENVVCKS